MDVQTSVNEMEEMNPYTLSVNEENIFKDGDGKELVTALLVSGMDMVSIYSSPNTNETVVQAQLLKSNKTTGCPFIYTIGRSESLGSNALDASVENINRTLFGDGEKSQIRYMRFKEQKASEVIKTYLEGLKDYYNYDLNTFKQQRVSKVCDNLREYAQMLNRLDKNSIAKVLTDNLIPLVQKNAEMMGVKAQEENKVAEEVAQPAEHESEPVHNTDPIS